MDEEETILRLKAQAKDLDLDVHALSGRQWSQVAKLRQATEHLHGVCARNDPGAIDLDQVRILLGEFTKAQGAVLAFSHLPPLLLHLTRDRQISPAGSRALEPMLARVMASLITMGVIEGKTP